MSFNIRSIREVSDDPQNKFISHLAKRISDFANAQSTQELENKEDIYSNGQDVDSVVKLHSDLTSTNTFNFDKQYYTPFEPDGEIVTLWLKGRNMGSTIRDFSQLPNNCELKGDPLLIDGTPFDYGIHDGGVKSLALRFNRPGSEFLNQEYIIVPDAGWHSVEGIATGISYFIRFRVHDISAQDGVDRRLFEKTDDSTPTNGVQVRVTSGGRLVVIVKRSGTEYKKQTATSTISTNTVYEVFITYSVSGNTIKVYVNNVDKSLTDFTDSTNWHDDLTNQNLYIFRRGPGSFNGFVYGDLYDFMIYREKVISSAEKGYHYTNKLTITDIPYGQVQVTNYYAIPWTTPAIAAYESDSYESDAFDV